MLFQANEKMQVVKELYHSRHYAQCAKLGERLIAEAGPEVSKARKISFHQTTQPT